MSSMHHNTPTLAVIDPRGLSVRSVAYHRRTPGEKPQACITQQVFDARGGLQEQWDPRLFALQQTHADIQPNQRHCTSLTGKVLSTHSVDAGLEVKLFGPGDQLLQRWDGRGAQQRFEFDGAMRPVAVYERGAGDAVERCVERMNYATTTAENAAHNRCGRLLRHDDPAGTLLYERYDLQGGVTELTRRFCASLHDVDWPLPNTERDTHLQAEAFTTTWQYDASGQVLEHVDAKGHRRQSRYGVDGSLIHCSVVFKSGVRKPLLDQRTYNAFGQVLSERAGNGVVTVAEYADTDGHLKRLTARKQDRLLQDLSYAYDPVGNVLSIRDTAQPVRWASNTQVDAVSTFEYDSLSRLIKATGRENASHPNAPSGPAHVALGAVDGNLWRQYTRHYRYDVAGNLLTMRHAPSTGSGFTQHMRVGERSNHSVVEQAGARAPGLGQGFDACGNQQVLARGQAITWNVRNQMVQVTQVMRENGEHDDEVYVYDAAGQRVIKRRVEQGKSLTHRHEVRYLPGLELHRASATGEWLDVLLVQAGRTSVRGLLWEQGRPEGLANEQLRFSLADHLGSSALELDEQAALLSQESYYPFGATAWWAAKNAVEASYKTLRYGGKERDASGLYYYGVRYYAPWLLRWISADPLGDVDGLNLYAMVGNNPVSFVDPDGSQRYPILMPLMIIVMLALAGYGSQMGVGMVALVAGLGFVLGIASLTVIAHGRHRPLSERRRQFYQPEILKNAQELGQRRGLNSDEINDLAAFFLSHRLAAPDTQVLSYGLTPAARGGFYGYIGPRENRVEAEAASHAERNPHRTLSRLGFSGTLVRASARKTGAAPLPPGGPTEADVHPQTRVSTVRRDSGAVAVDEPASETPGPSAGGAVQRLVINAADILEELRGEGGSIIRNVIRELEQRLTPFSKGHAYHGAEKTRGFDLPGYRGQQRRGAYRLLVQHVSGLNYRAVRVMNPHRG